MKWPIAVALYLITLSACTSSVSALKGIDLAGWKADRNGCDGKRAAVMDEVSRRRKELLGLGENEILFLLGKPDKTELYSHEQKFYHYFMTPSADCKGSSPDGKQLIIRFSALGVATEANVE